MKKSTKRRYFRWIECLVALVMLVVIAASCYMLHYALSPLHRSANEAYERLAERAPQVEPWLQQVRGQLRFNILLPDLSAHGQSTGDHIGMGWNERYEVEKWIDVATSMWPGDSVPPRVVLHGISMGAATVMTTAGDSLPPCVKAVVEDCGYTSVWDEFSGQMREQFGLSEFPILYTSSALCRLRYGWSFGEASPLKQVARCHLPMLFIHGGNDTFVPTEMVHRLYAAKPEPKQLWVAPGSEHARAFTDHAEDYERVLRQFLNTYFY